MTTQAPTMTDSLASIASALRYAEATATAIEPPSSSFPGLSPADAYAIAQQNVGLRLAQGARVVGHKIGLTAKAVQQQLGVDQPDYGVLLDVMEVPDGGTVAISELISPRVELELAFHLQSPLFGPGVTVADVRSATDCVQPSIELVDSRVADWRITLADTVADAASSARFVLGGSRVGIDTLDVADVAMELELNGRLIESGNTSAVLGDPCESVAWLANALGSLGVGLDPGHVILSGSGTRMAAANDGDRFVGHFGELGTVSLNFSGSRA